MSFLPFDPSKNPIALSKKIPITVLLIDDQLIIAEAVRKMLEDQPDVNFHYCGDPSQAIECAEKVSPTVILQDLVMPDIDGLMLAKYFRANPVTKDIPLIVLSTKEDPAVKAKAFSAGANDYLVKLPDKVELLARIRYHSESYTRLLERNLAYKKLQESQDALHAELSEAAQYVRSLLPEQLDKGAISTSWKFIPSTQLGGDAFGYHWLDSDTFAVFLLDVCGHGIGAALLSISVMNVLRSQTLPNINFKEPVEVLEALNATFPMENQNNMFFTIWYGIYDRKTHKITYSSGGHPPAVLIRNPETSDSETIELKTSGIVIGADPNAKYEKGECVVNEGDRLYIFSDGVYEIKRSNGEILQLEEFIPYLRKSSGNSSEQVEQILHEMQQIQNDQTFDDDFSILEVTFATFKTTEPVKS